MQGSAITADDSGNLSGVGTIGSGAITSTGNVQGVVLVSTQTTGTAPFTVSSTTAVANLNSDLLDGISSAAFALLTGATFTGATMVDGAADAVQFTVQGNATQTADLQVWENSAGTDLLRVGPAGILTAPDGNGKVEISTASGVVASYSTTAQIVVNPNGVTSTAGGLPFTHVGSSINLNDTNVRLQESGTNDLGLVADNATVTTLSSTGSATTGGVSATLAVTAGGRLVTTPQTVTIADDLAGTSPTDTTVPSAGIVLVDCQDANGCVYAPTETAAVNGQRSVVVNVSANTVTLDHIAGQILLNAAGDVALGTNDSAEIAYITTLSAYVQVGATGNN